MTAQAESRVLHASCVALRGRAALILGAAGAGKSALALRLISLGAQLVSDDRVQIEDSGSALIARCPSPSILGQIEARGVGILHAPHLESAQVALVVDLDRTETDRLPPRRTITMLGYEVPLVLQSQNDHFPAAIIVYLQGGRQDEG